MKTLRNTLFGACLALPLLAATGQAQTVVETQGRIITLPPGAVVLILPGPGTIATPSHSVAATPADMPVMQLIAQQQAAMQHMIAQMNAMFQPMPPMTNPSQLLRAAFGAGGPMLTLAAGPGVCSESVTVVQRGNAAPVTTRTASGSCGAPMGSAPHSVDQMRPAQPAIPQHGPKVLEISYPPHTMGSGTPPRT
jgi:hypothetical protein